VQNDVPRSLEFLKKILKSKIFFIYFLNELINDIFKYKFN
jgi:hypothetical protein